MVIYEVNLDIDEDIYAEYEIWLKDHIQKMLQFPGFIQATLLKEERGEGSAQEKLTVQYQLENRAALDRYFTEYAPQMRGDGLKLFQNKFNAERRVFNAQETFLK